MGTSSAFDAFLTANAPQDSFVGTLVKKTNNLEVQLNEEQESCQQQNQSLLQRRQQWLTHLPRQPHHLNGCCAYNEFHFSQREARQGRQPRNSFCGVVSHSASSPQLQPSIRRLPLPSALRWRGDLVQPNQRRQLRTSRCAASVGKQWQQTGYFPTTSQHFIGDETECKSFELPEKQTADFKTSVHSQFNSSERPPKAGPSSNVQRRPSTAMHSRSVAAAVAVTWQLLMYFFSVGGCWFPAEAELPLSSTLTARTASFFPLIFAVADYAAAPAYPPPLPEDRFPREKVSHCRRNIAKDDAPAPLSTMPWPSVPSCSPAVAAAVGGDVSSQMSGGFSLQQMTNCATDVSLHPEDFLSRAVASVRAAATAITHLYTSLYPFFPSVLQLWPLRYPESTFPHCLNFPTIQELSSDARAVRPALQRLKHKTFFRIFKFRLLAESCADTRLSELLNTRPDICTEPQRCGLCECSEEEVPSVWRQVPDEEFVDRRHAASFTRWTQHKSSRQPDDPFSIFKSPDRSKGDADSSTDVRGSSTALSKSSVSNNTQSRGVYVDLLLNPPMYTRYEGGDVWRFLYSQVPLPSGEATAGAVFPSSASPAAARGTPVAAVAASSNVTAAGGEGAAVGGRPGEGWPLVEDEDLKETQLCSSNANLRRVLSGMQANIAALAAENFFAVHPPNGHFDPQAAFPLLPASPAHFPSIENPASAAAVTQAMSPETADPSTSALPPRLTEEETGTPRTSLTTPLSSAASPTPPTFARNLPFFRERLADQPLRVQNLYFVFGLLLRAVCNLSDVLQECSCETGNRGEDLSARADLLHVLNVTTISTHACSPRYLNQPLFDPTHLAFLSSMESTDSLLRCIRCEKCRLHGKIKLGALYVAAKMLSSSESLPFLERNQVTALINALYYFADAIRVVEEMQGQINKHNIAAYVLFACLALLIVLTMVIYLPRARRRTKTMIWRTCESPTPSGEIDVKKVQ